VTVAFFKRGDCGDLLAMGRGMKAKQMKNDLCRQHPWTIVFSGDTRAPARPLPLPRGLGSA
jgi:hypothetical protein